jgi:hypothetical protein
VANCRERLDVNQQKTHRFHMERVNPLNNVKININSGWKTIMENVGFEVLTAVVMNAAIF